MLQALARAQTSLLSGRRALLKTEHAARMQACAASGAAPSAPAATDGAAAAAPARRAKPTQGELVAAALAVIGAAPAPLVDIGANLCDSSFDKDRGAVLARAAAAGLEALIITGSCAHSSAASAAFVTGADGALAAAAAADPSAPLPALYHTAGVHPHHASEFDAAALRALRALAAGARCVALGECGLDFFRDLSPRDVQERAMAEQVALAAELNLPLFLHCRDAFPAFFAVLRAAAGPPPLRGVLHCFTGGRAELEEALALGLHVGITGWITDEREGRGGAELAALLPLIPEDRLLIETDCPYITPRSLPGPAAARPRRNEPALLPAVLAAVAAARSEAPERVARASAANARRLFGLTH